MEFLDDVTLGDIVDNDVDVFLNNDDDSNPVCYLCKVFQIGTETFVDFLPKLNRKYVAPLPNDAVISRNDSDDIEMGRYGVFITRESEAGRLMIQLLHLKQQRRDQLNGLPPDIDT